MILQYRPASPADVLAMLLQARRHLELVGEDVLAKPVGVATAGSFLSGGVRGSALRPSCAGTGEQSDEKTETANHDVFPS